MLEMLDKWAENYKTILTSGEDIDESVLAAYKDTDAYVRTLPKVQQKIIRLRYLEGASWEGIGHLMSLRPEWVMKHAKQAIRALMTLIALKERVKT